MKKDKPKPSRDELIALLPTKGWHLDTGDKAAPKNGTLEELARAAHARHTKGQTAGLIKKLEATLELDLIHLQQLWEYMGLPM